MLRTTAIGAGASTASIALIAGILVWGGPVAVQDPITVVATETIPPTTYRGRYESLKLNLTTAATPSVVVEKELPLLPMLVPPPRTATPTPEPAPIFTSEPEPISTPEPTTVIPAPEIPVETTVAEPPPEPPLTAAPAPPEIVEAPMLSLSCAGDPNYNGTKPFVARVGNHLQRKFDVEIVQGVAGRNRESDHPKGLALDFIVNENTGDEIAEYVLENRDDFDVRYVIWKQRINYGEGWRRMADRGNATENHLDHVHVSFKSNGDAAPTC